MQHTGDEINALDVSTGSISVSWDGYVRMSLSTFMELPLVHFLSGLNDDPICRITDCDTKASISGYAEWESTTIPKLTIGWDWRLDLTSAAPRYIRESWPRSNVMIIDAQNGKDLGDEATAASIASRIDQIGWENDTGNYIVMRYA